ERRAIVELQAHDNVGPEIRTIGVGAAGVVPDDAEPSAGVRRPRRVVGREAVQSLEAADVAVDAIEHADLTRWPDPEPRAEQVARVERDAEHHLLAPRHIDAAAHAEAEQAEARAVVAGPLHRRRMELLRAGERRPTREQEHDEPCPPHDVPSFPYQRRALARAAARP